MFTQISSAGIRGMEGFLVSVEAVVSKDCLGFLFRAAGTGSKRGSGTGENGG